MPPVCPATKYVCVARFSFSLLFPNGKQGICSRALQSFACARHLSVGVQFRVSLRAWTRVDKFYFPSKQTRGPQIKPHFLRLFFSFHNLTALNTKVLQTTIRPNFSLFVRRHW